jgi:hypothetical protein
MDTGLYTYGQIKSQASAFVEDPTDTFNDILGESINDDYLRVCQLKQWAELMGIYKGTVSWVANQPRFYCPRDVLTPIAIVDGASKLYIESLQIQQAIYLRPSTFDQSATTILFSPIGDEGKQAVFSSTPEKIQIVSSVTADTSKSCRFTYLDSNGVQLSEAITTNASNGTTSVQSSATLSDLVRFSTSSTRTGVITVSGVTSGTVYARIGPFENTAVHKVLYLTRVPNEANAITLIYKKAPAKLMSDDDVPLVPISHYLRRRAMAFGLEFDDRHQEAQTHLAEAERMLAEIVDNSDAGGSSVSVSMPRKRPRIDWRRGYNKSLYV